MTILLSVVFFRKRRAAADRMLAAGEFYTGTTQRLKRICP